MRRTVVVLDLDDYTGTVLKMADNFDEIRKADVMRLLNDTIQDLVDEGLEVVRFTREECPVTGTGDGAQVIFESATHAHDFAFGFHEICAAYNLEVSRPLWFRIGVSTGELSDKRLVGLPIVWAVRHETAGKPGWILIDEPTFDKLPPRCRIKYGLPKTLTVKSRKYVVRRSKVVEIPRKCGPGVVGREELRKSTERFPSEVFAVELLTQPVFIERTADRDVTVTINRAGVKEMIISNDGKMAKTRQHINSVNKRSELEKLDRDVQSFLASTRPGKKTIDLKKEGINLRWASGGVLSIVSYKNREWVPLFFRDIRPYGWNISLGSTERRFTKDDILNGPPSLEDELCDPWCYISREFLEESLVFSGTPGKGARLSLRRFRFSIPPAKAQRLAREFDEEHREHRRIKDKIKIEDPKKGNKIVVDLLETKCSLKVKTEPDSRPYETDDVLVCFSLLDLGIEVVKIARYHLNDNDYMLDGEIRVKDTPLMGVAEKELVRMPIALISCDYLKKTFGNSEKMRGYKYTPGPQPSIEVDSGPRYDPEVERTEIFVFDCDVQRRLDIVNGEPGTVWEETRYLSWYDKFHRNFFDDNGRFPRIGSSSLFVPGTAKALNLYFATVLPD